MKIDLSNLEDLDTLLRLWKSLLADRSMMEDYQVDELRRTLILAVESKIILWEFVENPNTQNWELVFQERTDQ